MRCVTVWLLCASRLQGHSAAYADPEGQHRDAHSVGSFFQHRLRFNRKQELPTRCDGQVVVIQRGASDLRIEGLEGKRKPATDGLELREIELQCEVVLATRTGRHRLLGLRIQAEQWIPSRRA